MMTNDKWKMANEKWQIKNQKAASRARVEIRKVKDAFSIGYH